MRRLDDALSTHIRPMLTSPIPHPTSHIPHPTFHIPHPITRLPDRGGPHCAQEPPGERRVVDAPARVEGMGDMRGNKKIGETRFGVLATGRCWWAVRGTVSGRRTQFIRRLLSRVRFAPTPPLPVPVPLATAAAAVKMCRLIPIRCTSIVCVYVCVWGHLNNRSLLMQYFHE